MTTLKDLRADDPEDIIMETVTREWQKVTGLPLAEAGCFMKCVLGVEEALAGLVSGIPHAVLLRELPFLVTGEQTDVVSKILMLASLVERQGPQKTYGIAIRLRPELNSETGYAEIPLLEKEVPATPPSVEERGTRIWALYPKGVRPCEHTSEDVPSDCPTCKGPETPSLFAGKGLGDRFRFNRSPAPPTN